MPARSRLLAPLFALLLVPLAASAKPLKVVRLKVPTTAFGAAIWQQDGSGFQLVDEDQLISFDADGKPRGAPLSIAGLTQTATPQREGDAFSHDQRWWATIAQEDGQGNGDIIPYLFDLVQGTAKKLDLPNLQKFWGWVEWTGDGAIVATAVPPPGVFIIRPGFGKGERLCPGMNGRFAHVHPDGQHIGMTADKVYLTNTACDPLQPLPLDGSPLNFAFSPSGKLIAAEFYRDKDPIRLWVMTIDGQKRAELPLPPGADIRMTWLDEESVVFPVENGPRGTSKRTLARFDWRKGTQSPLVPPKPSCDDNHAVRSPRGGRLVFQRLCDNPADSFMGLVISR
jgi:hypothetical protein